MNALITAPTIERASLLTSMSLEEILADMQRHGLPSVSMVDKDGWNCSVNMYTNALGSEFKVRSEFKMPRPIDAARQCHDRMTSALAALGKS